MSQSSPFTSQQLAEAKRLKSAVGCYCNGTVDPDTPINTTVGALAALGADAIAYGVKLAVDAGKEADNTQYGPMVAVAEA